MWECHIYKFHICDSEFVGLILKSEILDSYLAWSEVKLLSRVRLFAALWIVAHQAPPPMGFSRQDTGVGCHFLLKGIFPTRELNPGLPHCRQTLYGLSHQGSPCLLVSLLICLFNYLFTLACCSWFSLFAENFMLSQIYYHFTFFRNLWVYLCVFICRFYSVLLICVSIITPLSYCLNVVS